MEQEYVKKIETGGFASVFKSIWNNQPVALKKPLATYDAITQFKNEIAIYKQLKHPNIVNVLHIVDSPRSYSLVMELMDTDLMNFLCDNPRPIPSMMRFSIALDIIRALNYLHNEIKILHRDLKPENILVKRYNETIIIKICDFGLAAPVDNNLNDFVGTLEFIAPELIRCTRNPYSIKSDMRAFAMIMWMLTSKRHPFLKAYGVRQRIRDLIYKGACDDIIKNTHIYLSKIIIDCRADDPQHRPVTADILNLLSEALTFPHELYYHELFNLAINTGNLSQERKLELFSIITQYPYLLTWALDDKGCTFLHYVFAANNTMVIDELVKLPQWQVLSQTKNIKNWTLLHVIADQDHIGLHIHLNSVDINAKTNNQSSALDIAAAKGHEECCRVLVKLGADVNNQSISGNSALIWAAINKHASICQLLLENNANHALRDNDNKTAEDHWSGMPHTNPFTRFRNMSIQSEENILENNVLERKETTGNAQPVVSHASNLNTLFKSVNAQQQNIISQNNKLIDTLVLAIDFDGCADTNDARMKLKNVIFSFLERKHQTYKKIVICIFSLRQSVWIDFLNAGTNESAEHISCSILGTEFIALLREELQQQGKTLLFENILTWDIYNNLNPGTTFQNMLTINYRACRKQAQPATRIVNNKEGAPITMFAWTGRDYDIPQSNCNIIAMTHKNKIDICYMFMQHFAQKFGSTMCFSFVIIDDMQYVLSNAVEFFSKNAALIPANCIFYGIQHNPCANIFYPDSYRTEEVYGLGAINPNFSEDMRQIRQQSLDGLEGDSTNRIKNYGYNFDSYLSKLSNKKLMHVESSDNEHSSLPAEENADISVTPSML